MEITKEFLKQRQKEYQSASEQHREQYIANLGATNAISKLIADISMEVVTEEEATLEDGTPLKDALSKATKKKEE